MTTQQFRSFAKDGTEQKMMPLLITDRVLVKPANRPPAWRCS